MNFPAKARQHDAIRKVSGAGDSCPRCPASLGFYRDLGFVELPVGDIRNYHYAVVTDGRIAIGLHSAALTAPALHFVHPDLEAHVRRLEAAGVEMLARRLGGEAFNEAELAAPDDIGIRLLEAPTFSSHLMLDQPEPAVGRTSAILVGSRRPDSSVAFWESQGFVIDDDGEVARLLAPGLVLALDRHTPAGGVTLVLRTIEADRLAVFSSAGELTHAGPGGACCSPHRKAPGWRSSSNSVGRVGRFLQVREAVFDQFRAGAAGRIDRKRGIGQHRRIINQRQPALFKILADHAPRQIGGAIDLAQQAPGHPRL